MHLERSRDQQRTIHAIRVGGVVFLIAASLVFFFGLGGTHSHGELYVAGADGTSEVRVPGSKSGGSGDEPIVPTGKLTFRLANASSTDHEFAIFAESSDGEEFAGRAIAGMDTNGPNVELKPGRYRIVCTTPGHESQGMSYELRVE